MRVIEPEVEILSWLLQSDPREINRQLEKPQPRFMPWLDLLAAFALAQQNEKSKVAVEKALTFRYTFTTDENSQAGWEQIEPTLIRLPRIYARFGETVRPFLSRLLTAKAKTEYPKAFLVESIEHLKELKIDKITVKKLTGNGEIRLVEKIEGVGHDEPTYSVTLKVDGKRLTCNCSVEQLYFQDIVEDGALKNKKTIVCSSQEDALTKANLLSMTYAILGYEPVKKK